MPESTSSAIVYRDGMNWMFYNEGHNIVYKRFKDEKAPSTVKLRIKGTFVESSGGALAALLHDESIRVYYIDHDRVIQELCLDSNSDDEWYRRGVGQVKTAKTSTLSALGTVEVGKGTMADQRIYYNSAEDPDMVSMVYKKSWGASEWHTTTIDKN